MRSPDGRECSIFLRAKKISLAGKNTTTLYLLNPDEWKVETVDVDNCAITSGPRCDWLILLNHPFPREELYIELKRSRVDHAVEQLKATIKVLSAGASRIPKRCFVVFLRNPMIGTDVQKNKVKFSRDFNAVFSLVRDKAEIRL
jgi:hypothetical protein